MSSSREIIINVDNDIDKRRIILNEFSYVDFLEKLRTIFKITRNDWKKYKIFYTDYMGTFQITNKEEFDCALSNSLLNVEPCLNIRIYYESKLSKLIYYYEPYLIILLFSFLVFGFSCAKLISNDINDHITCGSVIVFMTFVILIIVAGSGKILFNRKNKEYQIIAIIQKTDGKLDDKDYDKIQKILDEKWI